MRKLAFLLAQCLLLAGCTGLPRPREMGEMALPRILGVDGGSPAVTLTAAVPSTSSGEEGERKGGTVLAGEGGSLTAAALEVGAASDSYVFYGYVDKLLVGEGADLMAALGWLAQDDELGLGCNTWLLRGSGARWAVENAGEEGAEARLSALAVEGRRGGSPVTRTAGEIYIALLEGGCAFVPALSGGEELSPAGYAVVRQDRVVGYLDGLRARGLELLVERPPAEILEVGEVSLQITGAQLDCKPRFEGGKPAALELTSRVGAELRQWPGDLSPEGREEVIARTEKQVEDRIGLALEQIQKWGTDCVALGSRVSMAAPWHWDELEEDWDRVFEKIPCEIQVEVSLS